MLFYFYIIFLFTSLNYKEKIYLTQTKLQER